MVNRLQDKVAIITGAASGIGLESSILFLQEGAKVVLADINIKAIEEKLDVIKKNVDFNIEDKILIAQVDISKEAQVKELVEKCVEKFGKLNIIFNNAGIMHPKDDNAITTPEDIWDLTMNINLKGVWFGCKHAIEQMLKNGGGSIINTASFVAVMGAATPQLAYTASKGAVLAMSRELAMVHARDNIRVNSLCPGPLKTPLLMEFLDTAEKKERRMVHLPMGRFGEAIEQAYAALFLASDESSYITGTDFLVDGGLSNAYVTPQGDTKSVPPVNFQNRL
ncbi:NAD(P)-binding protein [Neoconidiobolus thromboides FSU 785]|nr:NAD(P)-binding protein [Neoconidiobolus thromboides FSU 785]